MTQGERDVLALAYLVAESPEDESCVYALLEACARLRDDRPAAVRRQIAAGAGEAIKRLDE